MGDSVKVANIADECVACGSCVQICPRLALRVSNGIRAVVDREKCVGCGKCANICPAAVITVVERGMVR